MNTTHHQLLSTTPNNRIISLDVLRGIAVLGILIMNIQSFSMISAAYINPLAYGDFTGINKLTWFISHMLASGKFMAIFSILFGAGIVLFTDRAIEKGMRSGPLHYKRMFWLLVFGLLHAYLIWYGDILVPYALCGALAFIFRKMKPSKLIITASVFFFLPVLLYLFFSYSIPFWPEDDYQNNLESWLPTAEIIDSEIASYQVGWLEQMEFRIGKAVFMQTFLFLIQSFWRIMGLMLLGMALFKWGVLSAIKSNSFYIKLSIFGLAVGFLIVGIGVFLNFRANWQVDFSMFVGSQFNYIGSVAVALGYIGLVMLICKSSCCINFKNLMSSVGRMAFTNYILMSLLAMFIFYGNGFGLFGRVDRWEQILFVFGIWIVILIISPIWLKNFNYGPLEWLWRVLTYWKKQALRKNLEQH